MVVGLVSLQHLFRYTFSTGDKTEEFSGHYSRFISRKTSFVCIQMYEAEHRIAVRLIHNEIVRLHKE